MFNVRAEVDNPNVWNLWAHDLDSGDSRRLTSNASGRPGGGSWFPDGHRIVYSNDAAEAALVARYLSQAACWGSVRYLRTRLLKSSFIH